MATTDNDNYAKLIKAALAAFDGEEAPGGLKLVSILDRLGWDCVAEGLVVQGARGRLDPRMTDLVNAGAFQYVFDMSREAKSFLKKERKNGTTIHDGHLCVKKSAGESEFEYTVRPFPPYPLLYLTHVMVFTVLES